MNSTIISTYIKKLDYSSRFKVIELYVKYALFTDDDVDIVNVIGLIEDIALFEHNESFKSKEV